ncbi:hypothetical protein [Christensenella tenuis]|uniref:Uncharacterized protein n=1 Tax=Christensenella tenuis TaxID=2763033 RepID=A0ABR7EFA6_9FIRM|nr:hypothetical protein [Christensenella tenuis]
MDQTEFVFRVARCGVQRHSKKRNIQKHYGKGLYRARQRHQSKKEYDHKRQRKKILLLFSSSARLLFFIMLMKIDRRKNRFDKCGAQAKEDRRNHKERKIKRT